uniref:Uncharacterized protein n=1 Tax=Anguilla anguilla TaxID=7936 RepID=A0A0E9PNX6_ANGAN
MINLTRVTVKSTITKELSLIKLTFAS